MRVEGHKITKIDLKWFLGLHLYYLFFLSGVATELKAGEKPKQSWLARFMYFSARKALKHTVVFPFYLLCPNFYQLLTITSCSSGQNWALQMALYSHMGFFHRYTSGVGEIDGNVGSNSHFCDCLLYWFFFIRFS